jgi:hypothetical protein
MSVSAQVTGNITLLDSVLGDTPFQKVLGSLIYVGTVASVGQSVSIGTSPTSISLPVSPTQFLYVKNLHATQTLTVAWTPNSGSSATILVLQPLGYIIFLEPNTTSGITALTLTGSGAATLCEYALAG